MSKVYKDRPIEDIKLDWSGVYPVVWLNGVGFEIRDEPDAHYIFEVLVSARDRITALEKNRERAEGLARTVLHFLETSR